EAGKSPARGPDLNLAEVPPVDLALLAGKGLEAEVGFGLRSRPHRRQVAPDLDGRARVAAGAHHLVDPRRSQPRVLLEDLLDELLVRVQHRRANRPRRRAAESIGLDRPRDGLVMDAELAGDGANLPVLGEV